MHHCLALVFAALIAGCASSPKLPPGDEFPVPRPPDYRNENYWAALPTTSDAADLTPGDSIEDGQSIAEADVFFVHPTIYRDTHRDNSFWNASLDDGKLNERVDNSTIRNQATIFNAAGKIYAPRYRQAHLEVFYSEGAPVKARALDTAYADVLTAFDFYVDNFNRGRPMIIAAHSQGTLLAERLLADRFDGSPLGDQLVAAYLIGMPIEKDRYSDIPVCQSADQTGCFVSWRTYRDDFEPGRSQLNAKVAVVNPLSWSTATDPVPASLNRGGILLNYGAGPIPGLVGAQIRGGALYTEKPRFFGNFLFRSKNYHVADYNFFWMNVRDNAADRVRAFR